MAHERVDLSAPRVRLDRPLGAGDPLGDGGGPPDERRGEVPESLVLLVAGGSAPGVFQGALHRVELRPPWPSTHSMLVRRFHARTSPRWSPAASNTAIALLASALICSCCWTPRSTSCQRAIWRVRPPRDRRRPGSRCGFCDRVPCFIEPSDVEQGRGERRQDRHTTRVVRRKQGLRPAQEVRGRRHVRAVERSHARRLEPGRRLDRQRARFLVEGADGLTIAEGLLEVVSDDLLQLLDPLPGDPHAPVREPTVLLGAALLGDRGVRGIADQDVPELERVLAGIVDRVSRTSSLRTSECTSGPAFARSGSGRSSRAAPR